MTDQQDRSGEETRQPNPISDDSAADIQEAQDRAGIAGEPQPTRTNAPAEDSED